MQAEVNVHGHGARVFTARRRDGGIDQADDRDIQFVRDTESPDM